MGDLGGITRAEAANCAAAAGMTVDVSGRALLEDFLVGDLANLRSSEVDSILLTFLEDNNKTRILISFIKNTRSTSFEHSLSFRVADKV